MLYIDEIRRWRCRHGPRSLPPTTTHPGLNNWLRYCRRAARRGVLADATAACLREIGIEVVDAATRLEPGRYFATPPGLAAATSFALQQLQAGRGVPKMDSRHLVERHAASWITRLHVGWWPSCTPSRAVESDALEVLRQTRRMLVPREIVARWLYWCARAALAPHRARPGTHWHQFVYGPDHRLAPQDSPWVDVAYELMRGETVHAAEVPTPDQILDDLRRRLPDGSSIEEVRTAGPPLFALHRALDACLMRECEPRHAAR